MSSDFSDTEELIEGDSLLIPAVDNRREEEDREIVISEEVIAEGVQPPQHRVQAAPTLEIDMADDNVFIPLISTNTLEENERGALGKFLTRMYDEDDRTRKRNFRVFDKKLHRYIAQRGEDNLYIIYLLKDILNTQRYERVFVLKYNTLDYERMKSMLLYPEEAWDHYLEDSHEIASDIPYLLTDEGSNYIPWGMAIYDPNNPEWREGTTEEEKRIVNELFVRERSRREHTGRFMKYGLDMYKLNQSQSAAATFMKNIEDKSFFERELQIPWFTELNNPLLEEGEGYDPIENEIYRTPCLLFAIKGQVSEECYKEIESNRKLTARGARITMVTPTLLKYGYDAEVSTIKRQDNLIKIRTENRRGKNKHCDKVIKLMFWEDHWMKYYSVRMGNKDVCLIKLFEMLKDEGLLFPYNVFEMAKKFGCFSFDSMLHWKQEQVQEIVKKSLYNGYEFGEEDWDKPEYNDPRGYPTAIFFADFEATTNEEYHVPFLICGRGYYSKKGEFIEENVIKIHGKSDGFITEWGTDCAENFLKTICKNIHITPVNMHQRGRKVVSARIYFFNLKYDFTFLFPYLSDIDKVEKEGRLYSVKGVYTYDKTTKVLFDFWDAYPIFQSTLARAGVDYLTDEEKKTIKKEAFPYKTYTYDFMESHIINEKQIANIFEFEGDPNYQAFSERIEEDIKETGQVISEDDNRKVIESNFALVTIYPKPKQRQVRYSENNDCIEETVIETIEEDKETLVKWGEYAEFYCCQDVRILAGIMHNMKGLMLAQGCEGIHGIPPFSQDLLKYRTASSLSYDYFLKTVLFEKTEDGWESRHNVVFPKALLRYLIQLTIRGGRVMCRDNEKSHYKATSARDYIQDYDAVSLYPSAMSKLWVSEGIPKFLNGSYTEEDFKREFCAPEDDNNRDHKSYTDGCIHLTWLYTKKPRHFPLLCIKDKKTGLNEYKNYCGEVDTWVNAIDLYNLIDFQEASFKYDMAVVWCGPRQYEIRKSISDLFEFRKANHGKGVEHPIQNVAKIMMNSIYGKSVLKASDKKKITIDVYKWRKDKDGVWEKYNYWEKWFCANQYRIHSFEPILKNKNTELDKVDVTVYCRDMSHSFNIFGSNVLAMARRLIGRVMALGEDMEELHPELCPGIFYTDTDSMHIRTDLLAVLEEAFKEKYGYEIKGKEMGQFHIDFDAPKNFKKGEFVKGADESWFIAKKIYADRLLGSQGSVGYHKRMKGVPGDLVEYEHYAKIYENDIVEYNLLERGKTSFFYKAGRVGCRLKMTRKIGTKEAKRKLLEEEKENKRAKKTQEPPSAQPMPLELDDIPFTYDSYDTPPMTVEDML